MNRKSAHKKIIKTFKDYIVPIFIVFIILIFLLNYIFLSKEISDVNINQENPISIVLNTTETEWYIVYSWWNKVKIETSSWDFFKSEKVEVVKWDINLILPHDWWVLTLNKFWELKYNENWILTLYSSDLWVNSKNNIDIEMRYWKITSNNESVFSLSQNEVASTIYVVSWIVEVKNLAWKSTNLQKWEKIVIMRNNANDENTDISLSKESIDDYIKNDDWFIKNNWNFYLNNSTSSVVNTWLTNSWTINQNNNYITFTSIYDEQELSSDIINIEWNILQDNVYKIELDWKEVVINNENKTFWIKDFKVSQKINDLVYKIYDNQSNLIYKWIITLYYSKWISSSNSSSSSLAQVQNYPITTSPLYQIISPKQNPYTTTENVVRIEWTVPVRTVEKIIINDYQLQQFPRNWTYWQYFANSEFGNLKEWVNIYKIQYYWVGDKIIYENNFTIIKEVKKEE